MKITKITLAPCSTDCASGKRREKLLQKIRVKIYKVSKPEVFGFEGVKYATRQEGKSRMFKLLYRSTLVEETPQAAGTALRRTTVSFQMETGFQIGVLINAIISFATNYRYTG